MLPGVLKRIIGRVEHDPAAVDVIICLAASPDSWIAADAIRTRVRACSHPFERFLDELVDDGFLERRPVGQLVLYRLTPHREVRFAVLREWGTNAPARDSA